MQFRYAAAPHPHLLIDEILPPALYGDLPFPDEAIHPGSAWGLTASDPEYAAVLRHPVWRRLYDELTGEPFVRRVLSAFSDDLKRERCLVDPLAARLVPFVESREEKERPALDTGAPATEIFTRVDFQSKGAGGYRDFVHLDWSRRLVGGILFFSDAEEEGLEGGELAMYRDRDDRNDRWCHDAELVSLFPPRHNSGVIFLNSNHAFHGPRAITRLRGRRRWLYYTISSQVNVWPHEIRVEEPAAAAR